MAVPYRDRQQYITRARMSGILPPLLKWRLTMGFPVYHLAATELVDGDYVEGAFEQGDNTPKKHEKNVHEQTHYPTDSPQYKAMANKIKVTYKKHPLPLKIKLT